MAEKPKRRSTEKRRERSRAAARSRRSREADLYSDLAALLPLHRDDVEQLDKASIVRIAIAYLKVRNASALLPKTVLSCSGLKVPEKIEELSCLACLDGFVFLVSDLGEIIYLSENVVDFLGILQSEVMGHSVFDFTHPCDHEELREVLRGNGGTAEAKESVSMLLRLKCTITNTGRTVNLKSACYKVINLTGHLVTSVHQQKKEIMLPEDNNNEDRNNNNHVKNAGNPKAAEVPAIEKFSSRSDKANAKLSVFMAVGRPIPHPSYIETPLGSSMFLSKHSVNMQFTYVDTTISSMLGYEPGDLIGKSFYEFHHAIESRSLGLCFKSLFAKGQSETSPYRFLAKRGGYAWVETQASIMYDRNQRPMSIVCINQVLSGIECKDEIYSVCQLAYSSDAPEEYRVATRTKLATPPIAQPTLDDTISSEEGHARPATAEIFAQRKKEMSKGMFLMFSDEDPELTMLKEEPADLSHLAPAAGDECVSLVNSPFDVLDELILDSNYCSLLPGGLDSFDSTDGCFADYNDDSPINDNSDFLLSPCNSKDSALLSPCTSPCDDDILTNFINSESDVSQSTSTSQSLYAPKNEDDMPLIGSGDMVMWGALPEHVNIHKEVRKTSPEPKKSTASTGLVGSPSLARLLADPLPQISVETTDLLSSIYPEPNVLPVWNNDEVPNASVGPIQMSSALTERASKRTMPADKTDINKRARCESNQLFQHLMSTDTLNSPNPLKVVQPVSRNPPQQANSVLMNLLVSGCDGEAQSITDLDDYTLPQLISDDETWTMKWENTDNSKLHSTNSFASVKIQNLPNRKKSPNNLKVKKEDNIFSDNNQFSDPLLCQNVPANCNSDETPNFDKIISSMVDNKFEAENWIGFAIDSDILNDFNIGV